MAVIVIIYLDICIIKLYNLQFVTLETVVSFIYDIKCCQIMELKETALPLFVF